MGLRRCVFLLPPHPIEISCYLRREPFSFPDVTQLVHLPSHEYDGVYHNLRICFTGKTCAPEADVQPDTIHVAHCNNTSHDMVLVCQEHATGGQILVNKESYVIVNSDATSSSIRNCPANTPLNRPGALMNYLLGSKVTFSVNRCYVQGPSSHQQYLQTHRFVSLLSCQRARYLN